MYVFRAYRNECLWSRDFTNAAWVKTNVTALKNQTGSDGTANAASSISATANNGTVLQSITLASSARMTSCYIKRLSGTGTLEMTTDGGATWTAVSPTSSWGRYSIPQQTVTNPQVGFRIGTSGDSFAVDLFSNDNTPNYLSTAIATTSSAVTADSDIPRSGTYGDVVSKFGSFLMAEKARGYYSWYAEWRHNSRGVTQGPVASDGGLNLTFNSSVDNTLNWGVTASGVVHDFNVVNKACGYIASDGTMAMCVNGGTVATATGKTANAALTHFFIGSQGSTGTSIEGIMRRWGIGDETVLKGNYTLMQQMTS